MKHKQINKISLRKLTIARITVSEMTKVKGGSSSPTEEYYDSHIKCTDGNSP
ncbi:class I lanthipeptide [Aquimarina sp. 2201CG14-23]|uniref:class I lanthipeptide n=1 Tax=Aquimarina mycalae TaxID=3040073 RepID=UPI002477E5EC|nr:class I lanthipeptide [Aquimarina sp. 2201CG14-23]MDH7447398.1 class I lanthipeptide [Aquimarina sp. 2201CG14-23]